MKIQFDVDDKPPKKIKGRKSCWSGKEAKNVLKLREKALAARTETGLDDCFHEKVKMKLTVYAPNIIYRKNTDDYIGDLDSLIGGILESIQPGPTKTINEDVDIDPILKDRKDVGPEIPLLVEDDAQVVQINAEKHEGTSIRYTVIVEPYV